MTRPTVILCRCDAYDPELVRRLTREALETLGLHPHGRTLVKPNCVAAGDLFPHAYTRPEFLEGVLQALKERAMPDTSFALGERCGITVPTRYSFAEAGYYAMLDRVGGVRPVHFEEDTQVEIPLYHQGRLRDSIYTPSTVASADFFVNCPKFKAHPWTTVTFSLKNYIGIQDDRHRLIDHDHLLNRKLGDLQYIIQPQFIAVDAITAGEGRMLTPLPYDLGLVAFGNNQVAFDAVCCAVIGLDPRSVDHIRIAHERGFGPLDLAHIDVQGDVSLDELRERASRFKKGLVRVEDYFQGSAIAAYGGPPPGGEEAYCWGGCPGALEEAIEILRLFDKATDQKLARRGRLHLVFGAYEGEIPAGEGERVVFIGDCATWHGRIGGADVKVESQYVDRSAKDPLEARHQDAYLKMVKVTREMWASRNEQVLRIAGCPVSVAEQVLTLVNLGGLRNPYFDPKLALRFSNSYLSTNGRVALNRLLGVPYNRPGAAARGQARPPQNLPAEGSPTPLER